MDCFSQRWRRTSPLRSSTSRNELVPSKTPRMNGWSWPPQVFQVLGWLVFGYLAVVSFGIYIPLLPWPWNHVLYSLMGIVFAVHFFTHVAAVTIDPADASVRAKASYASPMPFFDRTKQSHVIQDLHCYLCDVNVGPKVKHCGVCNKCVEDFDHHCKWMNTCIGGRNYHCFFIALSSATVGAFLLVSIILFVFIQHYLDPKILRTDPQFEGVLGNSTWLAFIPLTPVKTSSAGLLILAFLTVMLSIICLLLLCHLLGFHFYLFFKGISTYDYVKMQRQKESRTRDPEAGKPSDSNDKNSKSQSSRIDREPIPLQSSSPCTSHNKDTVECHISGCTKLEHIKKSTERKESSHHGTETTAKENKSWKSDDGDEERNHSRKSVDSVPEMQDPLGSSVMTADDT